MGEPPSLPPEMYSREYYSSNYCAGYDQYLKGALPEIPRRAFSLVQPRGLRILDVGCGRGELIAHCALFDAGNFCAGIDYSPAAIELAGEMQASLPQDVQQRIELRQADVKRLPFEDESFDVVFLLDIVEHLYPEELRTAYAEVHRVLKRGGRLTIDTPNRWLTTPLKAALHLMGKRAASEDFHINEQSIRDVKRDLGGRFIGRYWIDRQRRFWTNQTVGNARLSPAWARIGRVLDFALDNPLSSALVDRRPLLWLLGSNVWADLRKR